MLLTSAFRTEGQENPHLSEIFAALATNLLNDYILEIHLLSEDDCQYVKRRLVWQVDRMVKAKEIMQMVDIKLYCTRTMYGRQPSYADFFQYANVTLPLVDPEPVRLRRHGYVLSVTPPPHRGAYAEVFRRECENTPRCSVGTWNHGGHWVQHTGGGSSWDGYIFSPPLSPDVDLAHIDLFMNLNGAESIAAYQLEVKGGIHLYNPCMHIHAYHWHCLGGKMHDTDPRVRADRPPWYTELMHQPPHFPFDAVDSIYPCWNCPGLSTPAQFVRDRSEYCRKGVLFGVDKVPRLKDSFNFPEINVSICCSSPYNCNMLKVNELEHCVTENDVDCVTWESTAKHHYY